MAPELDKSTGFGRNVAFAWAGYFAQAVAGFVMPRLISDSLGQTTLGIWDLAWTFVSYLGFLQLGLSGSVNRFVARHRATGDLTSMIRSVSTVALFLNVAAGVAALLTMIGSVWVLPLFSAQIGSDLRVIQLVTAFLGLEVAITLMFAVNQGVIVGCLRSDVHYGVSTVVYTLTALGMAAALLAGGGLPAIAFVHLSVATGGEVARRVLARRVCPEFVVDYSTAAWRVLRRQARFTAKSTLPTLADLILNQSIGVLVAMNFGPAAMAIYARPTNLLRQVTTLIARFGHILVPTASSLHALENTEQLAKTVREKSLHVALATVPLSLTLAVLGDDLIRLWMGEPYVYPHLLSILALGALPTWVQMPAWSILAGMDRHGPLALAKFIASLCAAAILLIGLPLLHWGLLTVAIAVIAPLAIVDGIIVPLTVCRIFGFRPREHFQHTWLRPLLCAAPYGVCLMLARQILGGRAPALVAVLAVSTPVLAATYWMAVLPVSVRHGIFRRHARALHAIHRGTN